MHVPIPGATEATDQLAITLCPHRSAPDPAASRAAWTEGHPDPRVSLIPENSLWEGCMYPHLQLVGGMWGTHRGEARIFQPLPSVPSLSAEIRILQPTGTPGPFV